MGNQRGSGLFKRVEAGDCVASGGGEGVAAVAEEAGDRSQAAEMYGLGLSTGGWG